MEILVKKSDKDKKVQEIAEIIVSKAKDKAKEGIDEFTYQMPRGVYSGAVDRRVKEMTNNTVYVPAGGRATDNVIFNIKSE